jgi:hypothetical protein
MQLQEKSSHDLFDHFIEQIAQRVAAKLAARGAL